MLNKVHQYRGGRSDIWKPSLHIYGHLWDSDKTQLKQKLAPLLTAYAIRLVRELFWTLRLKFVLSKDGYDQCKGNAWFRR